MWLCSSQRLPAAALQGHAFPSCTSTTAILVRSPPPWESASAHASPHSSLPCAFCAGATKSHSQSLCVALVSDGDGRPEARAPWYVAPRAPGARAALARRSCGAGGAARAPGSSGSLHAVHAATAGTSTPLSVLCCAGQPGVGKTCLVYRYLYNTFGETISVRARLPPRLTPSQRAAPCHPAAARPLVACPLSSAPVVTGHLADHRGVVRNEEGRGQRQNLQPRHMGHRRPGASRYSTYSGSTDYGSTMALVTMALPPWLYLPWLYLLWRCLPGAIRQPLELLLPRRAGRHHLL